jgi:protein PET100
MAGPNLEVFKFAVYVFFPVLVFLHYGDPEWYQSNVIPVGHLYLARSLARHVTTIDLFVQYKERIFPSEERTARSNNIPTNHAAVRQELERIKAEKAARRVQSEHASEATGTLDTSEGVERLV